MNRITIQNQEYRHQKDVDGGDVLTYYDKYCQRTVKLKFPRESPMDRSDDIVELLSEAFITEFLSADREKNESVE